MFGHIPKHALERELSIHLKINKQYSNLFDVDAGHISVVMVRGSLKLQLSKLKIQMKINHSSRFDMIWCSPEARERNTARTATRKQSSRLNCAIFRLSVTRYVVTQDVFVFSLFK